jgi:hypothetical protein
MHFCIMDKITFTEAYARMREMRHDTNKHFTLHHHTYNVKRHETNGVRVVERARLRPALPDDEFTKPADMYLPYIDLDADEPRLCFRKLIQYVAFPPDFKLLKVNHYPL